MVVVDGLSRVTRPDRRPKRLSRVPVAGLRQMRAALPTLGLLCIAHVSSAQGAVPAAEPTFIADPRTLARIEAALERSPLVEPRTEGRRFFLEVIGRPRTWQEYMAGSQGLFAITPIRPASDRPGGNALGGGAGLDLLGMFRGVGRSMREREARGIRERIDRELRTLEPPPGSPPDGQ